MNPDSAVWAAFVSSDRRERMAAIRQIDDRRRSLGAELALNVLALPLRRQTLPPPAYYRLPGGKPMLKTDREPFISLAHAGNWAVCALHSAAVGVINERRGASPRALPVREWVGIESYLKLTGAGLSGGFRTPRGNRDTAPGTRVAASPAARWAIAWSAPPPMPRPACKSRLLRRLRPEAPEHRGETREKWQCPDLLSSQNIPCEMTEHATEFVTNESARCVQATEAVQEEHAVLHVRARRSFNRINYICQMPPCLPGTN